MSTIRSLGMADLPSVSNQGDVKRIDPLRRGVLCKNVMRLICVHLWPNQAQALRNAEYMGIDWHERHPHVEHQDGRCCFGSYACNAAQVLPGFFCRTFCQLIVKKS